MSTAPAPKADEPAEPHTHAESPTYEDSWYEVLRRSPAEVTPGEASDDPE